MEENIYIPLASHLKWESFSKQITGGGTRNGKRFAGLVMGLIFITSMSLGWINISLHYFMSEFLRWRLWILESA